MAIYGRAASVQAGWDQAIASANATLEQIGGSNMLRIGDAPEVADVLPDDVRHRLVALREIAEDSRAAYLALEPVWRHRQTAFRDAERRLLSVTDVEIASKVGYPRPKIRLDDGNEADPVVAEARAKYEATSADLDQINERRKTLARAQQQAIKRVESCEKYLAYAMQQPGAVIESFSGKVPKKFASIDAARAEIENIRAALDAAYTAPHPSSVVKAKIRQEIAALAERGAPNVRAAVGHGQDVIWPKATIDIRHYASADHQRQYMGAWTPDTLGLLAWAFKDTLVAALDAEIDKVASDKIALTDEQRDAKISELTDNLLAVERAEVALVDANGLDHRDDADPRALLGITGPAPSDD
ncbi:hypothetical protein EOD23_11590 [Mesorhizobium sp. USDA-HM6]|nr:hypothetical protein EOD23_11590 [Mesorhizobium sp. USDA-HM6]